MKTKIMKIEDVLKLEENTWGIDIEEAMVVSAGKLTFDKFATYKSKGQEMTLSLIHI